MAAVENSRLVQFLQDSRGILNVFVAVSALAGLSIVLLAWLTRICGWAPLTEAELKHLTFIFCIAALPDAILSMLVARYGGSLQQTQPTTPDPDTQEA